MCESRVRSFWQGLFPWLLLCCWLSYAAAPVVLAAAPKVKIVVQGLDGKLDRKLKDNVLAYLSLVRQQKAPELSVHRIRRLHRRAPGEIRQALEPFGYYRPHIEASLTEVNGAWRAVYRIDPGPPVRVGSVHIDVTGPGRDDSAIRAALAAFLLRPGDPFEHAVYEQAKAAVRNAATRNGYRDAAWASHRVHVDRDAGRADIELLLDTGPRFHFGEVRFEGSDLSPRLLRSYVPFQPGDLWSSRELVNLQRGLVDSNYFASVHIEAGEPDPQTRRVPLVVRLVPRKKHKYTIGAGFSTDSGPRFSLGWENRRINRRGHKLTADLKGSLIRQSLTGAYVIPLSRPRTDRLEFTAELKREDTVTTRSLIREFGVARSVMRGRWRETLGVSYRLEDFEVGSSDDSDGFARLLVPYGSWQRVEADNRLVTRRGYRLEFLLSGAARALASDTDYAQLLARPKWIRPMGANGRWILRADIGTSFADSVRSLPASDRFFAGGDQSIRGYEYRSQGPVDAAGEVEGGMHLLVASIEYDHRIYEKWHAAVFFDAGNAFNELPLDLRQGAGIGVRWESPVGMVRVDLAAAVSEPGTPVRLHFSFGPDL